MKEIVVERESAFQRSSLSEGAVVSDRSEKPTAFSRRGGANRPQRRRPELKQRQDKAKIPVPPKSSASRSLKPLAGPTNRIMASGGGNNKPPQPKSRRLRTAPLPKSGRTSHPQKRQLSTVAKSFLYALRLLIIGVGIGAIAGTLLSVLDPATRITAPVKSTPTVAQKQESQANQANNLSVTPPGLYLTQEIVPLKTVILGLMAKQPTLAPGIMLVDLDTGSYVDINAITAVPAASTIKVPILVAFFQDVDAGKIRLDETLTVEESTLAGGSGDIQYKGSGKQYTALEVATKMSTISDNTATNMLIKRLGGAAELNQRFRSWGLTATQINNVLPDLQGTNITSARDLAQVMALVNQGNLMSLRSRDRLLDIMQKTVRDTMLPRGLGAGATIAHKTGDIGGMVGDVGLVDMPTGKRYIAAVMVKRPHNEASAQDLIRAISRTAYMHFSDPVAAPPVGNSQYPSVNNQGTQN